MIKTLMTALAFCFMIQPLQAAETNMDILSDMRATLNNMFDQVRTTNMPVRLVIEYMYGDSVSDHPELYNMDVASANACKEIAKNISKRMRYGGANQDNLKSSISEVVFSCIDKLTGDIVSDGNYIQVPFSTSKNQPCLRSGNLSYYLSTDGFCMGPFSTRQVLLERTDSIPNFLTTAMAVFNDKTLCKDAKSTSKKEACRVVTEER